MTQHTQPITATTPDANTWDRFAATHPHGSMLQSAGWATLKEQFGWRTVRVAIADGETLLAGAQVLLRGRAGLNAVYVPRGPLLSGDPATDNALLDALDRVARRNRAVFLRLEPNVLEHSPETDRLHTALQLRGMRVAEPLQPHSSVHLPLDSSLEQIQAGMSKGHRADIRRAARQGVTVREGRTSTDLDLFYGIMEATAARAQFGIHSRSYYATMLQCFANPEAATLLLAEQDGQPVATAIIGGWGNTAMYLYSGSTEAGLKCGAQHAIQWHAVQWARANGCHTYDFWGVPDQYGQIANAPAEEQAALEQAAASDPLHGVYRFKKGFGGKVVRYLPAYDRVYIPPLYALWQRQAAG